MKFFLFIYLLISTASVYADHGDHAHLSDGKNITSQSLSAGTIDPDGQIINVNVFGLVCDFCAQAIEKVFMKRDEVSGIDVNLSEGLVIISTKKDKDLDDGLLTRLITDAGYNVDRISRNKPGN